MFPDVFWPKAIMATSNTKPKVLRKYLNSFILIIS
jgi:hypothetical protein